ncbi:hypothetical protein [Photobacterium angustum]|uniref:hypothetical protein n=1 Tax=Photobacterium angustum TaxID=661 RepID=UPI0005E371DC|nr:hypothetical protein [Photobacterium angustum]KJG18602.1 hypothetical protein UA33_00710 [Photobacterium angustum]KJG25836.1 hypothetical protein UA39_03265 [Photobacterium angustum]KJG34020.1 hypothetical protein UA36_03315 [Photobacterium angustum]PSW94851.1 hypothetical protein C0W79_12660 [Photobacterium angustum]PSX04435.1 hypothetical protein C0W87_00960 [Photobacterium angustum]
MRINSTPSHSPSAAKAAQIEKPSSANIKSQAPLFTSTGGKDQNLVSQLPQLLLSINSLQRLVTLLSNPLNSGSARLASSPSNSLNTIFQQLFAPQNQASLIAWLQQGGERKPLALLLQQLSQPQSQLNQWLKTLSPEQQQDIPALLRLAAEQRGPETQRTQDTNSIYLQWPINNNQSIDIQIKNEHEDSKSNADKNINSCWTVKLALPIGAIDILNVTAQWKNNILTTVFETVNPLLLHKIEQVSPLLFSRMAQLGINCESPKFMQAQDKESNDHLASSNGLLIKV